MNEPLEIPEHIRKAAATLEIFFKVNGINEWALMGIQSRRSEPELADEKRQVATLRIEHAIVEMQRDRLVEQFTTERAAREQAEKQILMDTECIERIRKAGETAEAWLAEAMDHIRWLQPMAKGWAHAHESVASNHRIVLAADEFLAQTTPPPPLAELTRLRALVEQAGHVGYGTAVTLAIEKQQQRAESAESALAALKAENTTLRNAQKEWDEKTHACLAAATGSAVSVHYREGGKFDSLTASAVRKLAANYAALKAELSNSIDQNDLLAALTRRGFEVSGLDGDEDPEDIVANWMASEIGTLKLKLESVRNDAPLMNLLEELIGPEHRRFTSETIFDFGPGQKNALKRLREALSQLNEPPPEIPESFKQSMMEANAGKLEPMFRENGELNVGESEEKK